jgi:hypothetical protein
MTKKMLNFNNLLVVIFLLLCSTTLQLQIRLKQNTETLEHNVDVGKEQLKKKSSKSLGPCTCPATQPISKARIKKREFQVVDEVINELIFKPPVMIGKYVFIQEDFPIDAVPDGLKVCPRGYRPFDQRIWNDLVENVGGHENVFESIIKPLQLTTSRNYILNTKKYSNTDKEDMESFIYKSLKFNSISGSYDLADTTIFKSQGLYTKCYLYFKDYVLNINSDTPRNVIYTDTDIQLILGNTNIMGAYWMLNEGENEQQGMKANFNFKSEGCYYIHVYAILMNGELTHNCRPLYVIEKWGDDQLIDPSKVRRDAAKFEKNAYLFKEVSLTPVSTPFATNSDGIYCIAFSDKDSKEIQLLFLDKNLQEMKKVDLDLKGNPVDVTRTSVGFAIIYMNEERTSFTLIGIDINGRIQYSRTIINNPHDSLTKGPHDIVFYKPDGKEEFGMNAMSRPTTAKLAYTNHRIGIIISRSNNFGPDNEGNSQIGMADYFISVSEEGEDEKLGFSWGASPSLEQRIVSDGYSFVTATLGGLYPKNIQVCRMDLMNYAADVDPTREATYKHNTKCMPLLKSEIPTDANGKSCGRLGGLVHHEGIFGVTYSRKPCVIEGENMKEDKDERDQFGLVLFNSDFVILRRITLGKGSNIVCLHSALFGPYISISFTLTRHVKKNEPVKDEVDLEKDLSFFMLVDFNGTIIQKPQKLPMVTCDEFLSNKDGSVASTAVREDGTIDVFRSVFEK